MDFNTGKKQEMGDGKTGIIIVHWRGRDDTMACLESLQQIHYHNTQVYLVDNASTDGLVEEIQEMDNPPVLLRNEENLGFVGGNNVGIQAAMKDGCQYLLLLNNDTIVDPDFLNRMIEAVEKDASIGIAGPLIYYHASPDIFWSAGGKIDVRSGHTTMIGIGAKDQGQFGNKTYGVDFVTGCCLLIRSILIEKIGRLDERFFAYFEDTEWCVRASKAGYRNVIVPAAKIWHKISPEAREASPQVNYYMVRNHLLFLKLTGEGFLPWLKALLRDHARTYVSWSIKPKWRTKSRQRKALLQGMVDFSRGRFGKVDIY